MTTLWTEMGVIHWPLAFSCAAIVALTLYTASRLFGASAQADPRTKAWIDGVLFWGAFAMVTGVLGTLVGIVFAAQAIEAMGQVSASLVWGGIRVALLSSVFGTVVLATSGLIWFGLQMRWRFLRGEAA